MIPVGFRVLHGQKFGSCTPLPVPHLPNGHVKITS